MQRWRDRLSPPPFPNDPNVTGQSQTFILQLEGAIEVASGPGQHPEPVERSGTLDGVRSRRRCQRLLQPGSPLSQILAGIPESPERRSQPQGDVRILRHGPAERRAQVVVLAFQSRRPDILVRSQQPWGRFLSHCQEIVRVSPLHCLDLTGRLHHLQGVLADCLGHREARYTSSNLSPQESMVVKLCQAINHPTRWRPAARWGAADGLGSRGITAVGKDREAAAEHPGRRAEQLFAPGNRVAERLVSLRKTGIAAGQNVERPGEPLQQSARGKHLQASGSQLDGQWQPFQPGANVGNPRGIRRCQCEIWIRSLGPMHEQLD